MRAGSPPSLTAARMSFSVHTPGILPNQSVHDATEKKNQNKSIFRFDAIKYRMNSSLIMIKQLFTPNVKSVFDDVEKDQFKIILYEKVPHQDG